MKSYDENCPWWGQTVDGESLACVDQCKCGPVARSAARQRRMNEQSAPKTWLNLSEPR